MHDAPQIDAGPRSRAGRLPSIDAFRYLAFASIAVLHSVTLPTEVSLRGAIDHATRYAVPFLFIASGYFAGRSEGSLGSELARVARRLFPVFAFWAPLYVVFTGQTHYLSDPRYLVHLVLTGAGGYHLWFLTALAMSRALLVLVRRLGFLALFACATAWFAAGLALGPYARVFQLLPFELPTRNGPFFGLLFVALGHWFSVRDVRPRLRTALLVAASGLALQMLEALFLHQRGGQFAPYDVLLGTAVFGAGMFLLSLSCGERHFLQPLSRLGRCSLGMYCVHVVFVLVLRKYLDPAILGQALLTSLLVIAGSTAAGLGMARIRLLERVVV